MHERSSGGVGTAHSTCKLPSNIPYSVALLDAQGGAVPPMPTQEQAPQIRHMAAEKSGQFRVRAWAKGRPGDFCHRAFNLIYRS